MNRVVVTGMGVVSPLGTNLADFWQAITQCRSAIGPLTCIKESSLHVKVAAEVQDFDPARHFDGGQLALMDRFTQFALVAAREAIASSGLSFEPPLAAATATIVGSGVGGQHTQDDNYKKLYAEGGKRLHPFVIPRLMLNAATSHITMEFGLTGPAFSVASACASAAHAVGQAFHMLRGGQSTVAITGGTEACITYGTMKGWEALRVMAPDTCRPFSRHRRGMVIGEGAAIFVLETLEHARRRDAPILAELVGFGMSSDAGDIVQPSAEGAAQAIRAALTDAGLSIEEIGYICAHGTGTMANDVTETRAIKLVFAEHARKLVVSSTKSMHGHSLGAAAALELAATIQALHQGVIPPTANFCEPDPDCDLDYVPGEARDRQVTAALSNSFAFGGLNAVLAARRFTG